MTVAGHIATVAAPPPIPPAAPPAEPPPAPLPPVPPVAHSPAHDDAVITAVQLARSRQPREASLMAAMHSDAQAGRAVATVPLQPTSFASHRASQATALDDADGDASSVTSGGPHDTRAKAANKGLRFIGVRSRNPCVAARTSGRERRRIEMQVTRRRGKPRASGAVSGDDRDLNETWLSRHLVFGPRHRSDSAASRYCAACAIASFEVGRSGKWPISACGGPFRWLIALR